MNLNELRDKVYKIACEHGFHDKEYSDKHWLMLIITELSEVVEADRKDRYFDSENNDVDAFYRAVQRKGFSTAFEEYVKDTVSDEIADAVIRLLDLAGLKGIELYNAPFKDLCWENLITLCYGACEILTHKGIRLDTKINATISNIIRWCYHNNIDLEWHIEQKMKYNSLRPYMHGKKY